MTAPDLEGVARRLGALIPAEAVHHGWNLADISLDVDETTERWSVKLLGPVEASTEELTYVGGPVSSILRVYSGSHGRITARTADDLERMVGEWILAVWGRSAKIALTEPRRTA